jgi:hypothetical protein
MGQYDIGDAVCIRPFATTIESSQIMRTSSRNCSSTCLSSFTILASPLGLSPLRTLPTNLIPPSPIHLRFLINYIQHTQPLHRTSALSSTFPPDASRLPRRMYIHIQILRRPTLRRYPRLQHRILIRTTSSIPSPLCPTPSTTTTPITLPQPQPAQNR